MFVNDQLSSLGPRRTGWRFAATLGVSFFLTPYLVGSLGKPRYDVWCVAESVLAYFTLLDMGLAACLVRFVAKHHASDDHTELNRMASTSLALFLGAGVVALVVGGPILWGLADRLGEKNGGVCRGVAIPNVDVGESCRDVGVEFVSLDFGWAATLHG